MVCIECGHNLGNKPKRYVAELENCVLIIKNVPTHVCPVCGERYYDNNVARKIEKIVNQFKGLIEEVAILEYDKIA